MNLREFFEKNIKGVGPAKAEKIETALYDVENIVEIVEKKELQDKLKEAIGMKLASSILEQLSEIKRQNEDVQLMVDCGIPYFTAIVVAKSELTMQAFKKDPYKIGRQNEIKFTYCDKFAHIHFAKTKKSPDMMVSRMQYMIEAMLQTLEQSGHTFAYLSQLTQKINRYQQNNNYTPSNYEVSTIILYLDSHEYVDIEKNEILEKWKIFRKEISALEDDIAYHIKRLSKNKPLWNEIDFQSKNIKYDEIQLSAIQSVRLSGLKVITGPPGSGKTAVINGIISCLLELNPSAEIILCAPTGRAAKHMSEITGKESSTIHKLLGITKNSVVRKKTKLKCDLVICDEASMLNLEVTNELLTSIPTGAIVYFVGDKDQLPAVGPGNVLHDIIKSNVVPVYHLTKVYRQDGIILENAHEINKGNVPTKTSELYQCNIYQDSTELKNEAIKQFLSIYDLKEPFETQILVPSYKTECGIFALNKAIQDKNPESFIFHSEYGNYKKYDKILMIRNSKDGLYQNGSVGIFLENLSDEIVVSFDGEETRLPKKAIEDMMLGYAVSVHKAQGSEFKHVILCLPAEPVSMLTRKIFYTAVTRAKHDICVMAMNNTIERAVYNNPETFSQTGLAEKIIAKSIH